MRRPLALLAALATLLVGSVVAPTPAVAADDVAVTWPEITAFNPSTTAYEITVDDHDGSGTLMMTWQGYPQAVSRVDATTVAFPVDGEGSLVLVRCGGSAGVACEPVATSPVLTVFEQVHLYAFEEITGPGFAHGSGPVVARFSAFPTLVGRAVTVDWQLVDSKTSVSHASGTVTSVPVTSSGQVRMPFVVPPDLPEGHYALRLSLRADTVPFGTLEGTSTVKLALEVDRQAPAISMTDGLATVYPARDDYLDQSSWWVRWNEPTRITFEVRDAQDRVISTHRTRFGQRGRERFFWNGRDQQGREVPEGTYTVLATATDPSQNARTVSASIRVSSLVLKRLRFSRSVSASSSMTSRHVGRCSSLAKRGGSLVLASRTRCQGRSAEDAAVVLQHRLGVPVSMHDGYRSLRITVDGRPATRASTNYLVLSSFSDRRVRKQVVLSDGSKHRYLSAYWASAYVQDQATDRPFLAWSVGLGKGSRYRVRSFRVDITYEALVRASSREPSRTRTTSPTAP